MLLLHDDFNSKMAYLTKKKLLIKSNCIPTDTYTTYYAFASCFNRIMHFGHHQGHFSCCCGVRPPGKPIKSLTGKDESVNPHKSTHQSLSKGTCSGTSPHLKPPPPSCCLGYYCKHFRGFVEFKSVDFNGPRRSVSKVKTNKTTTIIDLP